ncbi:MAG: hypothetical protein P8181_06380 [bacterium]
MLLDIYKETGVSLQRAFGVDYPSYFSHPLAEYDALVNHAAILDLTHWRVFSVTGNDRAGFLDAMLTNDIAALAVGARCHALFTTVKGGIIAELFVFAREDDHLVIIPQGDAEETVTTLEKHIINTDVTITDRSGELGILGVEGPKAEAVVKRLFRPGPFPKNRFDIVEREFETFTLSVIENACTGGPGYHVVVPVREVARIREYLVQAARGSDGLPVGYIAWNIRRAENGIPWYGVDYSVDSFPPESRLDHAVSYRKGCFRGQETLGRLHHQGKVNWLLVGLTPLIHAGAAETERDIASADVAGRLKTLTAEINELLSRADENGLRERATTDAVLFDLSAVYPAGSELFAAGDDAGAGAAADKPQGRITSAVVSPRLEGCLLLGYVRRELVESNAAIELAREGRRENLSLIDLPLESPDG